MVRLSLRRREGGDGGAAMVVRGCDSDGWQRRWLMVSSGSGAGHSVIVSILLCFMFFFFFRIFWFVVLVSVWLENKGWFSSMKIDFYSKDVLFVGWKA